LAILGERELALKKEILECKIQKEFLIHTIGDIAGIHPKDDQE